jgi:DNA-binding transcriptional LysR family regulator
MGWEEMTQRTCRELGGFEPDIRHRDERRDVSLALVARGLAVTLLPTSCSRPPYRGGLRDIAEAPLSRAIFAVTRASDARAPSTRRSWRLASIGTAARAS